MKLINPVGREVATGVEANYEVYGCYCSSGFSTARGTSDSCSHCGCRCNGNFSSNDSVARNVSRASR